MLRCPHARDGWMVSHGDINQVAATYDLSDVTGVYVLDSVPTHMRLAKIAFSELIPTARAASHATKSASTGAAAMSSAATSLAASRPPETSHNASQRSDGDVSVEADAGALGRPSRKRVLVRFSGGEEGDDEVTCSCHELVW